MMRKVAVIEVRVECDPVPGKFHNPNDWVEDIKERLPSWYYPEAKLLKVEDKER